MRLKIFSRALDGLIFGLCVLVLLVSLGRWTRFEGTPTTLSMALNGARTTPITYLYPLMVIAPVGILVLLLLTRLPEWRYGAIALLGVLQAMGPAGVLVQMLLTEQQWDLIISPFGLFTGVYWLHLLLALALAAVCIWLIIGLNRQREAV